jgi:hypothetical protein
MHQQPSSYLNPQRFPQVVSLSLKLSFVRVDDRMRLSLLALLWPLPILFSSVCNVTFLVTLYQSLAPQKRRCFFYFVFHYDL